MLQLYYEQLQSESIPCRYEYDDSHTTYGRMFIGVDAQYAHAALQSILRIVQSSKPCKQDMDTESRSISTEVEPTIARLAEPASESSITSDVKIPPNLIHLTAAPQEPAASSIDLQNEQVAENDVTPYAHRRLHAFYIFIKELTK